MRMLPDQPYLTNSQAELMIFEALKKIDLSPDTVGLHSLNLTKHEFKRFGELDFVVFGPEGLFALEVKGGRVSRDANGNWHYVNRFGEDNISREGPFKQVETGLHGLRHNLESGLNRDQLRNLVVGYGVVFPQCRLKTTSVEWDPHTLADEVDCRNFGAWLRRLIKYWRAKHQGRAREVPHELMIQIRNYLRPQFEAIVPLHIQTGRVEEIVVRMTEDQLRLVDIVAANPRVLCEGGAGTGKTFLAMELARRWTAEDQTVMFTCKSLWLKRYLETRLQMPNLVLSTVNQLPVLAGRQGIDLFDRLIVDEGQDLLNMDDLDILDRHLKGGLDQGQWSYFHDCNNQTGLFGPVDEMAWEYLQTGHPTSVPLRINCRNTLNILTTVQEITGADMGTKGAGKGPDVRFLLHGATERPEQTLRKELDRLLNRETIPPGEITILSPLGFKDSCVTRLDRRILTGIVVLDEYSMREFPPSKTSFASIAAFKGLENQNIIMVDLENLAGSLADSASMYVGMSRARAYLALIANEEIGYSALAYPANRAAT